MGKKLTQDEFIAKATLANSDKGYDYSNVVYANVSTKVEVLCSRHGPFMVRPDHLMKGHGCKKCCDEMRGVGNRLTNEEVISRLMLVVDLTKYDLSKVEYVSSTKDVVVVCKTHGDFLIKPKTLFRGCGCRQCFIDGLKYSQEDFINKARSVRPEYDYSLVRYKDSKTKVKVICPEHGVFSITPNNLLNGQGCSSCSSIGFDKNKQAMLYVYEIDGIFSFTGFGITRNIKKRSDTHKSNLKAAGCFVVEQYKSCICSGELILNLETLLKQTFPLSTCSKDIPGFKTESTTTPYQTVVAFVEEHIKDYIAKNK